MTERQNNKLNGADADGLICRWLDGTITGDDMERLRVDLRDRPAARSRLLLWVKFEDGLRNQLTGVADSDVFSALQPQNTTNSAPKRYWRWTSAAAAVVLVGLTLLHARKSSQTLEFATPVANRGEITERIVESGVAILENAVDLKLGSNSTVGKGEILPPGYLEIESGVARIGFLSGVSFTLSGPAKVDLISATEARLERGAARIRVSPAGRGFLLHTPGGKVVDLGTEFGIRVDEEGAESRIEVFDGEVEFTSQLAGGLPGKAPQILSVGESRAWTSGGELRLSPDGLGINVPNLGELLSATTTQRLARLRQWEQRLIERAADPRLFGLYRFTVHDDGSVSNLALSAPVDSYGGVVGATATAGRFGGMSALEFKRPGDRVRVLVDGEYQAITLACWVRIDSLDRKYNALYLTDGYERKGEVHWQIFEDGTLMFSVRGRPRIGKFENSIHYSEPFFRSDRVGRWFHLAATYDVSTGEVIQYVDGQKVGSGVVPASFEIDAVRFGAGEFGNWGLANKKYWPVRNLNGRIDEFAMYSEVLTAPEIAELYAEGRID